MSSTTPPVFRFAPSPNGALHLGHAYSALLNQKMAREQDGLFIIRIEDIDRTRCTREHEEAMLEDLRWLGVTSDRPMARQSERFDLYRHKIALLDDMGLIYRSFLSRSEIRNFVRTHPRPDGAWPVDPDGSPIYPALERDWTLRQIRDAQGKYPLNSLRLNMPKALRGLEESLCWTEIGRGPFDEHGIISADAACWGDIVLGRSDTPTSYHLSVVVDDALQGVTHVVRGQDLYYATAVHRLLQVKLKLPEPLYHHHKLILDADGRKLSKSRGDTSIRSLRLSGTSPQEVRQMVGFN